MSDQVNELAERAGYLACVLRALADALQSAADLAEFDPAMARAVTVLTFETLTEMVGSFQMGKIDAERGGECPPH